MYRAVWRFADLKDDNRIYEAGEIYPRPGFDVSRERIAELAGSDNRMGYPLIEAVETVSNALTDKPKGKPVNEGKIAQKSRRSRQKG